MPIPDSDRCEARSWEVTRRGLLGDAPLFADASAGPAGVAAGKRKLRTGPPNGFGCLAIGGPARANPKQLIGLSV